MDTEKLISTYEIIPFNCNIGCSLEFRVHQHYANNSELMICLRSFG